MHESKYQYSSGKQQVTIPLKGHGNMYAPMNWGRSKRKVRRVKRGK